MAQNLKLASLAVLAAVALAGCSGGGGATIQTPTPTPQPQRLEDQFGAGFGTSFRQGANTEPTDPVAADVEAVSLTTEPREIP